MNEIFIHPSAIVDRGSSLGKGTKIWHFSHIMHDVIIGENCNIGQNVFIGSNVKIGNGVKIQNNVSLYDGLIIEDDVFIGPSAVFTNVKNPRSSISRKDQYRPTLLGRGCTIGANATILCGKEIGNFSFVGAGSVVTKSIGQYELVIGNPARLDGWISEVGVRLQFNDCNIAICKQSGDEYILLSSNKVVKNKLT